MIFNLEPCFRLTIRKTFFSYRQEVILIWEEANERSVERRCVHIALRYRKLFRYVDLLLLHTLLSKKIPKIDIQDL